MKTVGIIILMWAMVLAAWLMFDPPTIHDTYYDAPWEHER